MGALSLVSALLGLLNGLVGYFRDKKMIDGAIAETVSANLRAALNDIQTATKVRDAVRAAIAANPSMLRASDPDSRD